MNIFYNYITTKPNNHSLLFFRKFWINLVVSYTSGISFRILQFRLIDEWIVGIPNKYNN